MATGVFGQATVLEMQQAGTLKFAQALPTTVAAASIKELKGDFTNRVAQNYAVTWNSAAEATANRVSVLWDIAKPETAFAAALRAKAPPTATELVAVAYANGVGDMFPQITTTDWAVIAKDGKIPKHATWAARIASGELAIDTLLTYAALQSFIADQKEMDDRIRKYL